MKYNYKLSSFLFSSLLLLANSLQAATIPTFSTPVRLDELNTVNVEAGATVSADGLEMYFHSDRNGTFQLYSSSRATSSDLWGAASSVSELNTGGTNRGASISYDGLTIYFVSDRAGSNDIYTASRASVNDAWGAAELVSGINTSLNDSGPTVSADGLTMVFHSDRQDNAINLYSSTRASVNDAWSTPVSLGPVVNDATPDVAASLTADGLGLYFHSFRSTTTGPDILYTSRADLLSAWDAPLSLASSINTVAAEMGAFISFDGQTFYFNRDGDLYSASVVPVPAAVWLFAAGLVGLFGVARRGLIT